jgi:hypothetical protein
MTIWLPLLISLASLALGIYNAVHGMRNDTARLRTELLTKIYGVQIGYEQFLRRIRALKQKPPDPLHDDLKKLIASEQSYEEFRRGTVLYLQALSGPVRLRREKLYEFQYHIDAMSKRTADDNQRLDELLKP